MSRVLGVLTALGLLLGAAGTASAATLYVAPSGSETGSCASTEPCSASRADTIVAPGDTVWVAPGSYGAMALARGGTSTAPVRWVSATRWAAHAPSVYVAASAPFVTVEGFDIDGGAGSLVVVEASYGRIVGNHVHGGGPECASGGGGIVMSGYQQGGYNAVGGEVLNNVVEDIGRGPRNGTCRTLHGISVSIPHVRIVNNVERRALAFGIHLWHAARDSVVVNNTVTDNGASGILIGADDGGANGVTPSATGNVVANNIVAANFEWGITECCESSPPRGPNRYAANLGWRNGYGNSASTLVGNVRGGGTVSDSLYGDPRFRGADDYHLQADSAAIDTGTSSNAPATDIDGTTRPQGSGIDRGASEAAASGGHPGQSPGQTGPSRTRRNAQVGIRPRRVRMSPHGTVRLRVACPRRERSCHVRLRLLRGRATIASKTLDVPGGAARTFTLKLSRSARRALSQSRLLRVRAVATVRTRAGHHGTTRTPILLQAPRA